MFSTEIVDVVTRHMNEDHADDSLLICRGLGERPEATEAVVTGLDTGGICFSATVRGEPVAVRIPWYDPVAGGDDIRAQVVRMYRDSCIRLGVQPRRDGTAGEPRA